VLQPTHNFILEYANKQTRKAILPLLAGAAKLESASTREAVEFAALNFDFHPQAIRQWMKAKPASAIGKTLTVSHCGSACSSAWFPPEALAALDGLLQPTGELFQFTPSVFIGATAQGQTGHRHSRELL